MVQPVAGLPDHGHLLGRGNVVRAGKTGISSRAKISARSSGGICRVKRPHMEKSLSSLAGLSNRGYIQTCSGLLLYFGLFKERNFRFERAGSTTGTVTHNS